MLGFRGASRYYSPRYRDGFALECRAIHMFRPVDLAGRQLDQYIVVGQVVGVHIDEACLKDGRFDMTAARSIARCGYMDYAVVDGLFEMRRPP